MNSQRAVSLIELLVVLAIVAIVISFGVPALKEMLEHNDDRLLQEQIISSIKLSQQTALTTHRPVTLCASKDAATCTREPVSNWISFLDDHSDGVLHDRQQLLAIQQNKAKGKLYWRAFPGYRQYLLFTPSGFIHSDNGTIWYCHPNAQSPAWSIVMNKSGRIRVASRYDSRDLPC